MLSQINIAETIEVPYAGSGGAFPFVSFVLQENQPYLLSHIDHSITAGAGILISSFAVRDETGFLIYSIPVIPWQFAGTTIVTVTMQTPEPNNTPLFAFQILSGFIAKSLYVFNGWTIDFATFGSDPGDIIDATITLVKSWQK